MKRVMRVFSILLMLVGAGICMYPKMAELYGEYSRKMVIKEFVKESKVSAQTPFWDNTDNIPQQETDRENKDEEEKNKLKNLYQELKDYNEEIFTENQKDLKDAFSYEDSCFDLTKYGWKENIIAVLWIPRLNQELPVYLGATKENMKKGAVLLGQTSMPLGGENSNCVIAAHRGGGTTAMFRNIQLLQIGDKIQLDTVFETLIYRVSKVEIILPDQVEKIMISPGEDKITLMTCHPYTKNTHRYLVTALRSKEESKSKKEDKNELTKIEEKEILPVAEEVLPDSGIRYSQTQIYLERYGTLAGILILLYVIIRLLFTTNLHK